MQIITTSDGSHSVYSEKFDSTYHSKHGAIQESLHVFIKEGLNYFLEKGSPLPRRGVRGEATEIKIFEMGFGTGLNVFLAFLASEEKKIFIEYTVVEKFPLEEEMVALLNYPELLKQKKFKIDFLKMHSCEWNVSHQLSEYFKFRKINATLEEIKLDTIYNIVFFDAFGPLSQPELWTTEIFTKIFNALEDGGILVTYSSKGQVRRNMISVGFDVKKVPGPPRKREMLRALKPVSLS